VALIFEKPKKKRKRTKHIPNKRITENIPCEICGKQRATSTHEVFNGRVNRNKSIEYGAQMKLCEICHRAWHDAKIDTKPYKQQHQKRIMKQEGWSMEKWIQEFGKNELDEDTTKNN
jgi:ribosome-binding protein aMBF1 (putative translation factor)